MCMQVCVEEALLFAVDEAGLCESGKEVVLVHGSHAADVEGDIPMLSVQVRECLSSRQSRQPHRLSMHGARACAQCLSL